MALRGNGKGGKAKGAGSRKKRLTAETSKVWKEEGREEGREEIRRVMERVLSEKKEGEEGDGFGSGSGSGSEEDGGGEVEMLPPPTQAFVASGLGAMLGRRHGEALGAGGGDENEEEQGSEDDEEEGSDDGEGASGEPENEGGKGLKPIPTLWGLSNDPTSTQLVRVGDERIVSLPSIPLFLSFGTNALTLTTSSLLLFVPLPLLFRLCLPQNPSHTIFLQHQTTIDLPRRSPSPLPPPLPSSPLRVRPKP
jgi:hypothetical protein